VDWAIGRTAWDTSSRVSVLQSVVSKAMLSDDQECWSCERSYTGNFNAGNNEI